MDEWISNTEHPQALNRLLENCRIEDSSLGWKQVFILEVALKKKQLFKIYLNISSARRDSQSCDCKRLFFLQDPSLVFHNWAVIK